MRGKTTLRRIHTWLSRRNTPERTLMISIGLLVGVVGMTMAQISFGLGNTAQDDQKVRLIIKYKTNINKEELFAKADSLDTTPVEDVAPVRLRVISLPKKLKDKVKTALAADARVQYVEDDFEVFAHVTTPNDTNYGSQWYIPKVAMNTMWDKARGVNGPIVAVFDSGVYPHNDLQGKLVGGYDYVNNDSDPTDDFGHGTAVAGVIAAVTNNSYAYAGGCWGCRIMPLKVLDSTGKGTGSATISALRFAADNGAKVMNFSLGGFSFSQSMADAIAYAQSKGAVIVGSAGNDASAEITYPAGFTGVVSVGATDSSDRTASFSNFGSWVDLAAPGVDFPMLSNGPTSTTVMSGTSFSAPLTSSVAAVLFAAFPQATPQQVIDALTKTTDICCSGKAMAAGRLNANKAYDYLAAINPPPVTDTTKPTVSLTAPATGASALVGSTVTLSAAASDNVGVTKVEFYNGTTLLGTDTTTPYSFTWNTTGQAAGTRSLTARAYDAANNTQTSAAVTFTLTTPVPVDITLPTVTLTAPANGATANIGATVTITATATDNVGVTRVEFYNGTALLISDTTSPYSFSWNTAGQAAGTKTLTAKAYDAAGNNRTSAVVSLILSNPTTATPGDVNGDGRVNAIDLSALISHDGQNYAPADFNKDGTVGAADMAILLSRWTW